MLSYIHCAYKTDILLNLKDGNHGESKVLPKLEQKGFIEINEIYKNKKVQDTDVSKSTMSIVSITRKGRIYLSNKNKTSKFLDLLPRVSQPFNTSSKKRYKRELEANRLTLLFDSADVNAFEFNKPSLFKLHEHFYVIDKYPEELSINYNNTDIEERLSQGIFYTSSEVREFVKNADPNNFDEDIMNGARFRGLYIDDNKAFLIYLPNIESNQFIKFFTAIENRLCTIVSNIVKQIINTRKLEALVVTNGDALMVDMALNYRNGIVKNKKQTFIPQSVWLRADCDLFEEIYAIPRNLTGVISLNYLCHHSKEEWKEESIALFESLENFDVNYNTDTLYVGIDNNNLKKEEDIFNDDDFDIFDDDDYDLSQNNDEYIETPSAIFIPFYNSKLFNTLSESDDLPSIITYPNMADAISHAIRRNNKYYDLTGKPINVQYYQQNGREVGNDTPATKPRRKPVRKKKIAIDIDEEDYKKLKEICTAMNISYAKLLRKLMVEKIQSTHDELVDTGTIVPKEKQSKQSFIKKKK